MICYVCVNVCISFELTHCVTLLCIYICRYYVYIHASMDVMKDDVSRQDSGAQDTGRHTGIIPTYSIVTRVNMGANRL